MPLRLAKFGVPLADTAPAGLAAAGIEPVLLPPAPAQVPLERVQPVSRTEPVDKAPSAAESMEPGPVGSERHPSPWFAPAQPHTPSPAHWEVTPDAESAHVAFGGAAVPTETSTMGEYGAPSAQEFDPGDPPDESFRPAGLHAQHGPDGSFDFVGPPAHASRISPLATQPDATTWQEGDPRAEEPDDRGVAVPTSESANVPPPTSTQDNLEPRALTIVDRYYMAWEEFRERHGREPKDAELSVFLMTRQITNRSGGPVSPSTLRRYFLEFRIYSQWSLRRAETGQTPSAEGVADHLAKLGITGQYSRQIPEATVEKYAVDFERRYNAIRGTCSRTWHDETSTGSRLSDEHKPENAHGGPA
ncbi:hypothetical protein ACWD01_33400, partial [Streptomyces sp. NPDC002835]